MKNRKRFCYIVLLLALVTLVFAACPGRGNEARARRAAGMDVWPGPAPVDLGGMVFRIADFHGDRFFPSEAEIGTAIGDAKLAVMESIEADFNVRFEIITVPPGELIFRLHPAIWAGDLFAHMVITTQWAFGSIIGAGLMGDLSAIPTLDLDSGLWTQSVHRAATINDRVLATAGIFEHWENTWVIYFQKALWNELNLPDPYELVRSGEWTWDRLLEFAIIAQQDLTGDGVVDSPMDRWGIVSNRDDFLRAWFASKGGLYFDVDPVTGRLFSPAATPDGIAKANWMRNFTQIPGVYYNVHGMSSALLNEMFVNRRALFTAYALSVPMELREMSDDFGILPMPKRNAQQATYLNSVNHNAPLIGITITNNQLEETGIIMEALAARFERVRQLQRVELENILLRSQEDVEMLDYIIPYTVFDIGHILFFASEAGFGFTVPHARLTDYVLMHSIGDFASEMEAHRESMEITVNEVFFGGF